MSFNGPPPTPFQNQTWCAFATGLLSFFALSAFAFLLLESICIAHSLVKGVTCPFAEKISWMVAFGFVVPMAYTAIAVPILYRDLVPEQKRM